MRRAAKILIVLCAAVILLLFFLYLSNPLPPADRTVTWGATFSEKFAKDLGLDWRQAYGALFSDLGIKHVRLVAYWDLIQPAEDEFDFSDMDYAMHLAEEKRADVILAVGAKVPRWPECHYPQWVNDMSTADRRAALINYLEKVAAHYATSSALKYLQIENEVYLPFGDCSHHDDPQFLDEELKAVRAVDAAHPILITSSGVIDPWYPAAKRADIFGTSLYRTLYNDHWGYVRYPLPPVFFRIKTALIKFLLHEPDKIFIVSELQGEPWVQHGLSSSTLDEQLAHFDINVFKHSVSYARAANFPEYYLWGAEWWYWMKTQENHPEFWDYAQTLFAQSQ